MQSKAILEHSHVTLMLEAARDAALERGWAVSISVVDDGGHPLGLLRLDRASPNTAYMAQEKARTAALGRRESKFYEEMINNGRTAFLSAPLQGLLEGAVPIWHNDQCLGAVGVSGVKSAQDAEIAMLAIEVFSKSL